MGTTSTKKLAASQRDELLTTLKTRFEEHMHRHKGMQWENVRTKLESAPDGARGFRCMLRVQG